MIYDFQANTARTGKYRAVSLEPYDILSTATKPGQGQGYFGDDDVKVMLYPLSDSKPCTAEEIVVHGISGNGFPTRLTLLRWQGIDKGYQAVHFVGNAGVVASPRQVDHLPISLVTTYNLLNDRGNLCQVVSFRRQSSPGFAATPVYFAAVAGQITLDFCSGPPNDPRFPESVVVALLRGYSPHGESSPTGASFLTNEAIATLPKELSGLGASTRDAIQVLGVTNPATAMPDSGSPRERRIERAEKGGGGVVDFGSSDLCRGGRNSCSRASPARHLHSRKPR